MKWPDLIKGIIQSETKAPDGELWTYERIGKAVGLSKATIGRLAIQPEKDIYFRQGKKLVDLYLKLTKKQEESSGSSN